MNNTGQAVVYNDPADTLLSQIRLEPSRLAWIDPAACIGCTKCIQACPFDSIIGSAKQLHFVLNTECTGCGLCVGPCPVDCIEMQPVSVSQYQAESARQRFHAKQERQKKSSDALQKIKIAPALLQRKAYIAAAVARIKLKRKC